MGSPVALTPLSLSPHQPRAPMRVKADRAAYGVGGKGFFDDKDKFWPNGSALYFEGEPNLDLHPLNKVAYEQMQSFLDKLDKFDEKVAKKNGTLFAPRIREEFREDGDYDEIKLPDSVMGAPKHGANEAIR